MATTHIITLSIILHTFAHKYTFLLGILGEIESCATGTKVHYRVRPGWDSLLFAALLLIVLLVGVVYKFLGYDNTYFLLAGSAINVIFHISVFWQMIACISQFNETIKDS